MNVLALKVYLFRRKEQCSFEISGNYLADVHSAEMRILDYYQKLHSCSVAELARILGVSRATLYNKLIQKIELAVSAY